MPGAGYGQFEHKADDLIAKFKEAGGTVRDWCRQMLIISTIYLHHICLPHGRKQSCRDNAITYKAQRDKNARKTGPTERGNYWHADASAWCCCARCKKYTKELADAKAENDALRDDVAAGRRRLHIKAVCPISAWLLPPRRGYYSLPDWQTPLDEVISPSEGWSLCKNNWKEPRSILMSSADRVAHIDGQLMQLLWAIHTRFQRSINA